MLALLVILLTSFGSPSANAFPELVRDGYVNCTTCHVSPSGGGLLTPYGRALSKEVLSTWGKEGEEEFIYGIVKTPAWLNAGGDVRGLQTYMDTPTATSAQLILMQADAEAAVTLGQFTFDSTAGYTTYTPPNSSWTNNFIARRYFIEYKPLLQHDEWMLRAGKFIYDFGINTPDHFIATKRGLMIGDEGFETFNLEASYVGEVLNTYVTGILGRPDNTELQREQGIAVSSSVAVAGTYKIGASYLYGKFAPEHRSVIGPFGILGFTPHFYLLTEEDFQAANNPDINPTSNTTWGIFSAQKLGYEFVQGFHGFLTQEFSRSDFTDSTTVSKEYGIGVQWFPRPHFEFIATYQLRTNPGSSDLYDYAYLMMHYYL